MKFRYLVTVYFLLSFSGCAANQRATTNFAAAIDRAESFSKQGKWIEAYRSVEDNLRFSKYDKNTANKEEIIRLIQKYPDIILVGAEQNFMSLLSTVKSNCTTSNINTYFAYLTSLRDNNWGYMLKEKILNQSRDILNECLLDPALEVNQMQLDELKPYVGVDYFSQEAKAAVFFYVQEEERKRLAKEKNRTGVVLSVQISDTFHVNNGAGAQLGSAYGQAIYLDSAKVGNYSAASQLNSGIAGALIGSMLADKPTSISFLISYFVKMPDGEIKKIEQTSTSATHIPEGVCVVVYEPNRISIVNQNNCPPL